jgi:hypothetical protein
MRGRRPRKTGGVFAGIRRCLAIIRRSRTVNVGQAPRIDELYRTQRQRRKAQVRGPHTNSVSIRFRWQ